MESFAGKSQDGKIIISGEFIFSMIDSLGFPLYLLIDLLEESNLGFDVIGFIKKAKTSKNYENNERLLSLFRDNVKSTNYDKIMNLVEFYLKKYYK